MLDMQKLCNNPKQGSTKNPWYKMDWFSNDDLSRMLNCDFKIDFGGLLDSIEDPNNMNSDEPIQNDAWLNSSCLPLRNSDNVNSNRNFDLNGDLNSDWMLRDFNSSTSPTASLPPSPSNDVKPNIDSETKTAIENIIENGFENGFESGYENGLENDYGSGLESGYDNGLENGYENGLENGYENGLEHEFENGLKSEIESDIGTELEIENENGSDIKLEIESKNEEDNDDDENDTETENEATTGTEDDTQEEEQKIERLSLQPIKLKIALSSGVVRQVSPSIHSSRTQTIPNINTMSGVKVHKVKVLQNSNQTVQQVRKQLYNMHFAQNKMKIAASPAKREKPKSVIILRSDGTPYPKPGYSYSCLIAMALKNSRTGLLPVSKIYDFMCENFPYFYTASSGWKNSVRHNLSLNKCFEKIEKTNKQRKGCLWGIHKSKLEKMDKEIRKWSRKDLESITDAMPHPERLELLERGTLRYVNDGDFSEETSGEEEEDTADGEDNSSEVAVDYLIDNQDDSSQNDVAISEQETISYEMVPAKKRIKVVSPVRQRNYMPERMPSPRRKTSVLVQAGAGTSTYLRFN